MKEEYEKYRQELMKYMKNPPVSYVSTMGAACVTGGPVLTVGMRLAEYIKKKHEPFNECLFKMIDSKGLKESDVYKQAGLSRQMFSKIRCKKDYTPTKTVMLSLAVGMHLSVEETEKLLASGNQLLSRSDTRDLIVRFFMEQGKYDLDLYNEYLHEYHQHLLGSSFRE